MTRREIEKVRKVHRILKFLRENGIMLPIAKAEMRSVDALPFTYGEKGYMEALLEDMGEMNTRYLFETLRHRYGDCGKGMGEWVRLARKWRMQTDRNNK